MAELYPLIAAAQDTGGEAAAGKWYVKAISMVPLRQSKLNYESRWATLTFEVK